MKKKMRMFVALLFVGVLFSSSLTVMAEELDYNSFNMYTMYEWVSDTCRLEGVTTSLNGVYSTRNTRGLVVLSSQDAIRKTFNVPMYCGKELSFKFYDTDATKAPLAIDVINQTAAGLGCQVGPTVNIELGVAGSDGSYTLLPNDVGPVKMMIGIPEKFFDRNKTYAMICVREGGAISVYPDLDTNPWSVTFDTTGGYGTYAIVRY